MCLLLIIYF